MEKFVMVLLCILCLVCVLIFLSFLFKKQIDQISNYRKIYPFNTSATSSIKKPLTCPAGQKINVIGAWTEVMDPFGECSDNPSAVLKNSCGNYDPQNSKNCKTANDCGVGMTCDPETNKCVSLKCTDPLPPNAKICPTNLGKFCNGDCGSDDLECKLGYCVLKNPLNVCFKCSATGRYAQYPLCANMNDTYQNIMCNKNAQVNNCKIRDASAYLAKECNGKETCDISSWNGTSSNYFGPLPCNISLQDDLYDFLPYIPGWYGGPPMGTSKNSPGSYNKGYYVHGIYTCV